jgi:3',5'-cyclic-nucleotide phosphodiesterase
VDLRIVGCHGGETPRHRTSAFVLDGRIAIDAGSLTSEMDLPAQWRLEACLVSHAHLDHIRDLATIADNRAQHKCPPLVIAGTKMTIAILKKHFFNGLLWPDFTKIPNTTTPSIVYQVLRPERTSHAANARDRAEEAPPVEGASLHPLPHQAGLPGRGGEGVRQDQGGDAHSAEPWRHVPHLALAFRADSG